jgi:hypothetical protein
MPYIRRSRRRRRSRRCERVDPGQTWWAVDRWGARLRQSGPDEGTPTPRALQSGDSFGPTLIWKVPHLARSAERDANGADYVFEPCSGPVELTRCLNVDSSTLEQSEQTGVVFSCCAC